jgi:hypothetical protein
MGAWKLATASGCREVGQTWSFRGSKSRNKVSVGEPAEGSLDDKGCPLGARPSVLRLVSYGSSRSGDDLVWEKEKGKERDPLCASIETLLWESEFSKKPL